MRFIMNQIVALSATIPPMLTTEQTVRATLLVAAIFGAFLSSAAPAEAYTPPSSDAAAWLYKPTTIVTVDLQLPEPSIESLNADGSVYVPGTFTMRYGRKRYGPWNVEVRLKGRWGSARNLGGKAAFKVKFPDSRHRVNGLKKLTLNNMVQDPSYITETISYELFRAMGVPAPRTGYAVVSVNGVDYGLHLNVETPDKLMFSKWFPREKTKHLYEGSYGCCYNWHDAYDGNHFDVDEGDPADRSDLAALLATLELEGEAWRHAAEQIADLHELTAMWAVELYVGHWDGYAPTVNNYYIHNTESDRITMHPWGLDQTLGSNGSWMSFSGQGWGNLLDKCLTDVICSGYFSDAVIATRNKAVALALDVKAATVFESIRALISADSRREFSVETANVYLDATVNFLLDRPESVSDWYLPVSPPVSPAVSAGAVSALLSWRGPEMADGVNLGGFLVEYRRARSRTWTALQILDPEATSTRIMGLSSGSYEFKVSTISSRGTSEATGAVVGVMQLTMTTYANCESLNAIYDLRAGVLKSSRSRNSGAAAYGSPLVSSSLYRKNQSLDVDRDGIACEATSPLP
jgi:CotH kinase protein/Excalibur calcium-binding domain